MWRAHRPHRHPSGSREGAGATQAGHGAHGPHLRVWRRTPRRQLVCLPESPLESATRESLEGDGVRSAMRSFGTWSAADSPEVYDPVERVLLRDGANETVPAKASRRTFRVTWRCSPFTAAFADSSFGSGRSERGRPRKALRGPAFPGKSPGVCAETGEDEVLRSLGADGRERERVSR